MRYTPYSETEIQSMNVMDAGIYIFEVLDVETEKNGRPMQDKNGNDMAKLKLLVWDKENKERTLFTFISGDGNFAYKLRHFAKSIGMIEEYESGMFKINATIGKSGKADIVIKKGTMKSDGSGEMWADRNDVKDFVVDSSVTEKSSNPVKSNPNDLHGVDDLNDAIPF